LRCELYEYSSEAIDTGDSTIDSAEDENSLNTLVYQFTLEDGSGVLKGEDGGTILQEYTIETTAPAANNAFFQFEADSILDFSERNPFSEVDRY
jgi:hypothetical protein